MCTNWIFSAPDKWEPMSECPLDKYVDGRGSWEAAARRAGYTQDGEDDSVVIVFSGTGTTELSKTFHYLVWFQTGPLADVHTIWLKDFPSLIELLGKVAGFATFWETRGVRDAVEDI